MAEEERGERVVLTIGAIGRGIMSEPETVLRLQDHVALEEALEPYRRARREREAKEGAGERRPRKFADLLKKPE